MAVCLWGAIFFGMSITPSIPPEAAGISESIALPNYPFRLAAISLLSAAVPGVGHFLLGQRRKGVAFLVPFLVLLSAFWPLRLLRYYEGFVALFGVWILLGIYASCSAFLSSRTLKGTAASKRWLFALIPASFAVLSLSGAVMTRLAGFRSFEIPSTGMDPTIREGDHIVADMEYYRSREPHRFDTILFKRGNIIFIKRVIAVGGDSIEGKAQRILINDEELNEPYVEHIGEAPEWANTFGPVSVPAGEFFVMGDNRDYSLDSRDQSYGLVGKDSIVGKPLYVFATNRTGKSIH